jgi:hypothetical protein
MAGIKYVKELLSLQQKNYWFNRRQPPFDYAKGHPGKE